jgi:hypothetical protein
VASIGVLTGASAACSSCVASACAGQQNACDQTPACSGRLDCELGCYPDDVACRTACVGTTGGDAIGLVDACEENSCAPACAHACGDLLPIVPPSSAQACATCVAQQCCMEASACGTNTDCRAGLECARGQSAPDAVNTCLGVQHPGGTADSSALAGCVKDDCNTECAYGNDWSCLGAVKPPSTTTATLQGTITVLNGSAQSDGVPGLKVRGCYITDESCTSPVTPSMTTDKNGNVSLTLPATSQAGTEGFLGYFEVTDPAGQYLTGIATPGFPITQNAFTQAVIVISVAEAQSLATAVQRTYDPTTGSLVVTASDCAYQPTPGASFKLGNVTPQTILVYSRYGIPDLNVMDTDSTGVVVGAFLPPGSNSVTVKNSMGQVTSITSFFTRANAVTLLIAPVNQ